MVITSKYNIGDKLYMYTKEGLQLQAVERISVRFDSAGCLEMYSFSEWGEWYTLEQIVAGNLKNALKAVKRNADQLQLDLIAELQPEGKLLNKQANPNS